jgi:hypothetical protein
MKSLVLLLILSCIFSVYGQSLVNDKYAVQVPVSKSSILFFEKDRPAEIHSLDFSSITDDSGQFMNIAWTSVKMQSTTSHNYIDCIMEKNGVRFRVTLRSPNKSTGPLRTTDIGIEVTGWTFKNPHDKLYVSFAVDPAIGSSVKFDNSMIRIEDFIVDSDTYVVDGDRNGTRNKLSIQKKFGTYYISTDNFQDCSFMNISLHFMKRPEIVTNSWSHITALLFTASFVFVIVFFG